MRFCSSIVIGLMAAAAVPAGAANILVNGGFEAAPVGVALVGNSFAPNGMVQQFPSAIVSSQYLSGWTIATPEESNLQRGPYNYSAYPANAYEGSQFFSLNWSPAGGVTLDNTITQTFSLTTASSLSFSTVMTTETGFASSTLQVTILDAAAAVVAQSDLFTNSAGNAAWDFKTFDFALGAGTYTIALHGIGAGNAWDVLLDDVRLDATAAAVPEPATWAMMLAGFGMVGAGLRRRSIKTMVSYA
jgi:hypothetical protein